jgi:hypothetical protein
MSAGKLDAVPPHLLQTLFAKRSKQVVRLVWKRSNPETVRILRSRVPPFSQQVERLVGKRSSHEALSLSPLAEKAASAVRCDAAEGGATQRKEVNYDKRPETPKSFSKHGGRE